MKDPLFNGHPHADPYRLRVLRGDLGAPMV
jgi:hypothetical protein